MITEALEFLFGKSDEFANRKPQVEKLGPRKQAVTLNGNREIEILDPEPLVRIADTLGSVATLVNEFGGDKPTFYVNHEGVAVVLDDCDRVERVSMKFQESVQFATLKQLESGRDQRTVVRLLRTTLAGCVDHNEFLGMVRQLEFDVNRGMRADVQHTKESLGRSVEKEVRSRAGEMPESVRVRVPLFTVPHDINTTIELECAITLDIDNEKIAIEATGDTLERERKRVLLDIIGHLDSLVGDNAVVVFGSLK